MWAKCPKTLSKKQKRRNGSNDYHGLLQHHRPRDLANPADPDRRDHAAARQDVQQHGQGFLGQSRRCSE